MNFISPAFADTAATTVASQPTMGGSSASYLLLLGFVIIFYFLLWRPQAKRAKDHRNLISSLAMGDEVTTSGGLAGKISKLGDDFIGLTVGPNVEITIQKNAVTSVLPKGTLKSV